MSTAALAHSLFDLPVSERILLADQLYASVPDHWQRSADEAWLAEAERRSAEMDADPSLEITHEAFLAAFPTMWFSKSAPIACA
ncbi:MAG: addiction module protein [Verrucomicrobiaceae bacterium]